MKCLKKLIHRPQIYLGFCALLLFVFLSCGLSQDSYATSGTCTYTLDRVSSGSSLPNSTYCSDFDNNSLYFYISDYDLTIYGRNLDLNTFWFQLSDGNQFQFRFDYSYGSCVTSGASTCSVPSLSNISSYVYSNFSSGRSSYYNPTLRFNFYGTNSSDGRVSGTFTVVYSDSLSDLIGSGGGQSCPEPEEPVPCPPIPENPYDDKLDAIKIAIYSCGASLFVIYFFVCIYKIIVKDGGSRK